MSSYGVTRPQLKSLHSLDSVVALDVYSSVLSVYSFENRTVSIISAMLKMFNLHFGPLHAIHPSGTNEDPDSKVHGANMGPTWVLSAPDGPHVGPKNLAIRRPSRLPRWKSWWPMCIMNSRASLLSCAFGKNVLNFCWLSGERAGMAKIKPGQTWQVAFKFKFNTSLLLYFKNIHT